MNKFCSICRNTDCNNHGKNIIFYGDNWKCKYIPVQTNADRIRAMTDEELAKFIAGLKYRKTHTTTWEGEYVEVWRDSNGNEFPSIKSIIEHELFVLQQPEKEDGYE